MKDNYQYHLLFCNRADCFSQPGGDTVQMLKTKEYLETSYPVKIDIVTDPEQVLVSKATILHIFNIRTVDQTLEFVSNAKKTGKKIILSPIFWDLSDALFIIHMSKLKIYQFNRFYGLYKLIHHSLAKTIALFFGKPYSFSKIYKNKILNILINTDLILPNSAEELKQLEHYSGLKLSSSKIIFNAIDTSLFKLLTFTPPKNTEKVIVCAARIEPIKNQLSLVRALSKNNDIHIILVGKIGSDKEYANLVKKEGEARGNFTLIADHIPQHELINIMKKAHVHALPSFSETTGLSSIEALCCGLRIVVSEEQFCPVQTYFGEKIGRDVFVCNPYEHESIKNAVLSSINLQTAMKKCDEKFSWENTAHHTFQAYQDFEQ